MERWPAPEGGGAPRAQPGAHQESKDAADTDVIPQGGASAGLSSLSPAGSRIALTSRHGPYFAVGPELGLYARAGSQLLVSWDGSTHGYRVKNRPLLHLGGMARLGLELGRVRPSFVMGLGWYQAANSIVGLSMGAQVEVRFTDWLPLVIDARLHEDLFALDLKMERYSHQHYRSLGLGTRLTW